SWRGRCRLMPEFLGLACRLPALMTLTRCAGRFDAVAGASDRRDCAYCPLRLWRSARMKTTGPVASPYGPDHPTPPASGDVGAPCEWYGYDQPAGGGGGRRDRERPRLAACPRSLRPRSPRMPRPGSGPAICAG